MGWTVQKNTSVVLFLESGCAKKGTLDTREWTKTIHESAWVFQNHTPQPCKSFQVRQEHLSVLPCALRTTQGLHSPASWSQHLLHHPSHMDQDSRQLSHLPAGGAPPAPGVPPALARVRTQGQECPDPTPQLVLSSVPALSCSNGGQGFKIRDSQRLCLQDHPHTQGHPEGLGCTITVLTPEKHHQTIEAAPRSLT